jgi:hypothetical protein
MKKFLFGLIILALVFFLFSGKGPVSCRSRLMNGEEYMESFSQFVERTRRECGTYTARDWARSVQTYQLYSGPLYERFEPELSFTERMKFRVNRIRFIQLYEGFRTKEIIDEAGGKIESISGKIKGRAKDLKNRLLDTARNLFPQGGD